MPINLTRTNRCKLIKDISSHIWKELISFHTVGANSSEIYYTKKLLSEILTHSKNLNFSIWASEPGNEKKWGSDIDIYIERQTNNFELYAFQAKVLKLGDLYDDLDRRSLGTYQWEKLETYKLLKKCHINYLFFNGVRTFKYNGINKCFNSYSEEELGLSYVSVDDVRRITLSKNSWGFSDFHPTLSHPVSELVCCFGEEDSTIHLYNYQDIIRTLNKYQKLEYLPDIEQMFAKAVDTINKDDNNNDKKIRNADVVLVIRNTSSSF